jgi:hypothetical protein
MRLSDLLERVRPAGAPGASAEGETRHAQDIAQRDLAEIARALAEFAKEADELVAAARSEVVETKSEAGRCVQQIRAGRADRLAQASAAVTEPSAGSDDDDPSHILDASRAEAEHERTRAKQQIPRLVDAAVEVIWSDVFATPTDQRL